MSCPPHPLLCPHKSFCLAIYHKSFHLVIYPPSFSSVVISQSTASFPTQWSVPHPLSRADFLPLDFFTTVGSSSARLAQFSSMLVKFQVPWFYPTTRLAWLAESNIRLKVKKKRKKSPIQSSLVQTIKNQWKSH